MTFRSVRETEEHIDALMTKTPETVRPPQGRMSARRESAGLALPRGAAAGPSEVPSAAVAEMADRLSSVQSIFSDRKNKKRWSQRFNDLDADKMFGMSHGMVIVPTDTVALGGVRAAERRLIRDRFGLEEIQDGPDGSWLLRVPESGEKGVQMAFEVAQFAMERGHVESSSPNMLSLVPTLASGAGSDLKRSWGLDNPGTPGVVGADVHALAAWTITEGDPDIRVAVLDEGVDSLHPWLKDSIVDEFDVVDENEHARPDGNDFHGTACAGIIASRHATSRGLAPGISLVGIRIAKRDTLGSWSAFDNWDTAKAIRWAVDNGKADVLSNSWFSLESDLVTAAFRHAMEKGRNGKGCVVVVAAGNLQTNVLFPATVEGVIAVGASNQWDKRKTRLSQDGESLWGSNHGPELDLLAPGVGITTTDLRGSKGLGSTLSTDAFSGTSAAAPHVAATAALMLSIESKLMSAEVAAIINATADSLTSSGERDNLTGHGRLNAFAALREARRHL